MPSYVDIDGVPASADPELLGTLLRDQLGFDGLVVSDYYAVSFLELQHAVAAAPAGAAALALAAGIDVELPTVRCYGEPLRSAVEAGDVAMEVVDRAVARVLRQKFELGMLDPGWSPIPGDARRHRPGPARASRAGPPPRRGVRRAARQRRRAPAGAGREGWRWCRPARRRPARVLRLLHHAQAPGSAPTAPAWRSPPCSTRCARSWPMWCTRAAATCGPRTSGFRRGSRQRPFSGKDRRSRRR